MGLVINLPFMLRSDKTAKENLEILEKEKKFKKYENSYYQRQNTKL